MFKLEIMREQENFYLMYFYIYLLDKTDNCNYGSSVLQIFELIWNMNSYDWLVYNFYCLLHMYEHRSP